MQKHIRSKNIHKLHLYLLIYLGLFIHTSLNAQQFEDIKQLYSDESKVLFQMIHPDYKQEIPNGLVILLFILLYRSQNVNI